MQSIQALSFIVDHPIRARAPPVLSRFDFKFASSEVLLYQEKNQIGDVGNEGDSDQHKTMWDRLLNNDEEDKKMKKIQFIRDMMIRNSEEKEEERKLMMDQVAGKVKMEDIDRLRFKARLNKQKMKIAQDRALKKQKNQKKKIQMKWESSKDEFDMSQTAQATVYNTNKIKKDEEDEEDQNQEELSDN
ncbi:MAG: hypothetical protein EZS28_048548, partial [Streblomastix strix]